VAMAALWVSVGNGGCGRSEKGRRAVSGGDGQLGVLGRRLRCIACTGNFPGGPWADLGAGLPVAVGRAQLTNLKEFPIIHCKGTIYVTVAATVTPGVLH
jgi:hypothetical protein